MSSHVPAVSMAMG